MGNSESFAAAINEPLSEGAEFTVLERRREWVRIEVAGGLTGWIEDASAVYY